MPTISEPIWRDRDERLKIAVRDFVEAKPRTIDDSIYVLEARLFALGLRGSDLHMEAYAAQVRKDEYRKSRVPPGGKALDYYASSIVWLKNRKK
jgi:hypothetical protein